MSTRSCCQHQYIFSKSLKVRSDYDTKMTEYVLADKLIVLEFGIFMYFLFFYEKYTNFAFAFIFVYHRAGTYIDSFTFV